MGKIEWLISVSTLRYRLGKLKMTTSIRLAYMVWGIESQLHLSKLCPDEYSRHNELPHGIKFVVQFGRKCLSECYPACFDGVLQAGSLR
jgi:hypothetical protein